MIDLVTYLTYVAACIAIVIVPGPSVTVIIANSLRYGSQAGMLNVAGTQAGLVILLTILATGLSTIVQFVGVAFEWIRILGAAYLIWLGIQLWRSRGKLAEGTDAGKPRSGFFWQGFLVILSNPKALVFFGAFIPQFIDPAGSAFVQTLLLGGTFMIVATVLDSAYAFASGGAGAWLTGRNVRIVERVSGSCLIGGGIWLAVTRQN